MKITRIYTDGACSSNPGPGGYSAIVLLKNKVETISGYESETTNNRMELRGVIEGLNYFLNLVYQGYKCDKLEIYSDSAYVVNAIVQNWIQNWKLNKFKTTKGDDIKNVDLWLRLDEQLEELKFIDLPLMFIKIKGHNGNNFNEMADKVAKNEIVKNKKEG